MAKYYDVGLKDRLAANNDKSDVVLNVAFRDWTDLIAHNLNERNPHGGDDYSFGKDKDLLALCREHAQAYAVNAERKSNIVLTHPLYMHLSHMDEIRTEKVRCEADAYLDRLLGFLNSRKERPDIGVVVLETLHHYAAATSLLLENGMVDRVIFTEYDCGCPLDPSELDGIDARGIYLGGGYNGRCLECSIKRMRRRIGPEHLWAVQELVLNSPQDYTQTLLPESVYGLDDSRMITFDELLRRLSLKYVPFVGWDCQVGKSSDPDLHKKQGICESVSIIHP